MDARLNGSEAKIIDLPVVVMSKIIGYLTFEEMSHARIICKFFQKYAERALNEGFVKLGKLVTQSSINVKKQLPKRESERRSHPLSRYSEVFSALETRYTLLSMTYKKHIDMRHCCFIPGKVLDVTFAVVNQINEYLAQNTAMVDIIPILRDIRDYSSMAMEHFDEHIAPQYPSRSLIPSFFRPCSSIDTPTFLSKCCTISLSNDNRRSDEVNLENCFARDNFSEQLKSFRFEMRNKIEEQNRIIDEQQKVIKEQGRFIRDIVDFLGEMGRQTDWTPLLKNRLNRLSVNYVNIGNDSASSSTLVVDNQNESDNKLQKASTLQYVLPNLEDTEENSKGEHSTTTEMHYFFRNRKQKIDVKHGSPDNSPINNSISKSVPHFNKRKINDSSALIGHIGKKRVRR